MATLAEVERWIKDCTGEYVVSADWAVFMKIWEALNYNPTKVKQILKPVAKRLTKKDQNTLFLTLELLESIVKNCPCAYAFVGSNDVLNSIAKLGLNKKNDFKVQTKALELIQSWNKSFANFDQSRYHFHKVYLSLCKKNVLWPPLDESSPVFTPPVSVPSAPAVQRHEVSRSGADGVVRRKRGHSALDMLPPAHANSLTDEETVTAATNSAKLLLELLGSAPSRPTADSDFESGALSVIAEVSRRCEKAHRVSLPAIITSSLDSAPAESDDNSSLLTRALAASDALDEALASYRRWRALDDVVSIERSQEHVQIPRAVLDEQYDDVPQGDVWWGKGPAAAGNGGAGGPGARGLMATYDLSSSEDSVPSSPRDSLEFHPISAKKDNEPWFPTPADSSSSTIRSETELPTLKAAADDKAEDLFDAFFATRIKAHAEGGVPSDKGGGAVQKNLIEW